MAYESTEKFEFEEELFKRFGSVALPSMREVLLGNIILVSLSYALKF